MQERTPELIQAAEVVTPATAEIRTPSAADDGMLLTPVSGVAPWAEEASLAEQQAAHSLGPTPQVTELSLQRQQCPSRASDALLCLRWACACHYRLTSCDCSFAVLTCLCHLSGAMATFACQQQAALPAICETT